MCAFFVMCVYVCVCVCMCVHVCACVCMCVHVCARARAKTQAAHDHVLCRCAGAVVKRPQTVVMRQHAVHIEWTVDKRHILSGKEAHEW